MVNQPCTYVYIYNAQTKVEAFCVTGLYIYMVDLDPGTNHTLLIICGDSN